jgi:hypothetical protein
MKGGGNDNSRTWGCWWADIGSIHSLIQKKWWMSNFRLDSFFFKKYSTQLSSFNIQYIFNSEKSPKLKWNSFKKTQTQWRTSNLGCLLRIKNINCKIPKSFLYILYMSSKNINWINIKYESKTARIVEVTKVVAGIMDEVIMGMEE